MILKGKNPMKLQYDLTSGLNTFDIMQVNKNRYLNIQKLID